METVLSLEKIIKDFGGGRRRFSRIPEAPITVLRNISLSLKSGERLGLVGESGSGKTTLARIVLGILTATRGKVTLLGRDVTELNQEDRAHIRCNVQMVFQDPLSSLNATKTVEAIIRLPLVAQGLMSPIEQHERVKELTLSVGLSERYLKLKPHQLSGGERQRVGIARALAIKPNVLVLDEPTASLDVSVQAKVLLLLEHLQEELNLSQIMISHNLGVIRHVSDRIAVIYLGQIVESGMTDDIFSEPAHPYTQTLFSAIPVVDDKDLAFIPERLPLKGEPTSVTNIPAGCPFHPRCSRAMAQCKEDEPVSKEIAPGHTVMCHLY